MVQGYRILSEMLDDGRGSRFCRAENHIGLPSFIKLCDGDAGPLLTEYEIMNEVRTRERESENDLG